MITILSPTPATADLATHSLWCAGQLAVEHRSRAFYSRTRRAHGAIYGAHPVACGRRDVRMSGAGPLAAHEHPVHVTPPSFSLERRSSALAISPSAHVVQAVGPVMRSIRELVRSDQTRPGKFHARNQLAGEARGYGSNALKALGVVSPFVVCSVHGHQRTMEKAAACAEIHSIRSAKS